MAPPSKLGVATQVVVRLVKEEASYHKEQEQQEARIKKLETTTDEENAEYLLRQEQRALEETKNVFPSIRAKITKALENLEEQLEVIESGDASAEDITKAKDAIAAGKKTLGEVV